MVILPIADPSGSATLKRANGPRIGSPARARAAILFEGRADSSLVLCFFLAPRSCRGASDDFHAQGMFQTQKRGNTWHSENLCHVDGVELSSLNRSRNDDNDGKEKQTNTQLYDRTPSRQLIKKYKRRFLNYQTEHGPTGMPLTPGNHRVRPKSVGQSLSESCFSCLAGAGSILVRWVSSRRMNERIAMAESLGMRPAAGGL